MEKKGLFAGIKLCVFLSENTTMGILLPGEGVKRVEELVKYDQLKKLNSSGAFFFTHLQGVFGEVLAPRLNRKKMNLWISM